MNETEALVRIYVTFKVIEESTRAALSLAGLNEPTNQSAEAAVSLRIF